MKKFWNWYKNRLAESITFVFVIHIMQIPHMVWNADVYLELGNISRINPVFDFILYGVDLMEIPSIVNVTLLMIYHWKNKKCQQ